MDIQSKKTDIDTLAPTQEVNYILEPNSESDKENRPTFEQINRLHTPS